MTKNQYNEIAAAFKHLVSIKQLQYAQRGSDKDTGYHTNEGRDLYDFFRSTESTCFATANALADGNPQNFDRDTFLKKAGMMEGRGTYGSWSFVPNKDYIAHFNR